MSYAALVPAPTNRRQEGDDAPGQRLAGVLRAEMARREWNQARLAAEAGIARQELTPIMQGACRPSAEMIAHLARAVSLEPTDLLIRIGLWPERNGDWPALDTYLHEAAGLDDDDVAIVAALIGRLQASRRVEHAPMETKDATSLELTKVGTRELLKQVQVLNEQMRDNNRALIEMLREIRREVEKRVQ